MLRIETAIYTGNGTAQQVLMGGGPDLALTKRLTGAATVGYMLWRDMPRNLANAPGGAFSSKATQITDLTRDGIYVGAGQSQNAAPYLALTVKGVRGSKHFATGRFTTNNTAGRNMQGREGCGFQPDYIHMQRRTDGSAVAAFRHKDHTGTNSNAYGSAQAANLITALLADGFQLGNSPTVNGAAADQVDWWAMRAVPGAVAMGSFDGTGAAQDIQVGFRPTFVLVKNRDTADPGWMLAQVMVDGGYTAMPLSAIATDAQTITGFHANGFSVGTSAGANGAGNKLLYLALKDGTYYPGRS